MALVTYQQAKNHLRPVGDQPIEDVLEKMEQATAIVIKFLDGDEDDTWTAETDPATDTDFALVQAAILTLLGDLWFNTGDQMADWREDPQTGVRLPPKVQRIIHPLRRPSFA